MKVVLIVNFFPPQYTGGAEVSAFNSCYGLRQEGVDCSILSINARSTEDTDRTYELRGVPVHQVTYRRVPRTEVGKVLDWRIYRRIVAELERERPDLVHVHNVSGTSLAPFVATRRLGLPTVATLHDQWLLCPNNMLYRSDGSPCDPAEGRGRCPNCFRRYDFWGDIPLRRTVLARLVRNVRLFIAPSRKLMELHVRAGYDPQRFRILKSGLEPGLFDAPSRWRWDPAVSRSQTMLFAGAVVENKGVGTLLEALPILARYLDGFRLLIAGDGEARYMAGLRQFAPAHVHLLGRLPFSEMRALYGAVGLTVVPSISYENSPLVVYESLLAGTPVLGSAIGGIPELIEDGETGYLYPPRDPVALAERVILHFASPAVERRAMRRRCAEYARAHLTLEQHVDGLLQVYQEALGLRCSTRGT